MSGHPPVVVVGAGIAGLTLAISLARAGLRVVVLERAMRLSEVGAGLQLSPNATNVLLNLGLGSALDATGVRPEAVTIRSALTGADIVRMPLGKSMIARYGAPYIVIHRADLQSLLLHALGEEPRVRLKLGVETLAYRQGAEGVEVDIRSEDGEETVAGALLVGADGVRSQVRQAVIGGGKALYSGHTAWRATLPVASWSAAARHADETGLWLGARAHLVHYPIDAGRQVNLVAVVDDDWREEGWDAPGDPAEIAAVFADWPETVRSLVALPESWRRWALCAAPASRPWVRGRTVLVGDAAHAMLPFVAQGAAMAIEDARVLTAALTRGREPTIAGRLHAYEARRRARVESVVRMARRNGAIYHLGGLAAKARDLTLAIAGADRLLAAMDWIYGWRPADL